MNVFKVPVFLFILAILTTGCSILNPGGSIVYCQDPFLQDQEKDGEDTPITTRTPPECVENTLRLGSWNVGSSIGFRSASDLTAKANLETAEVEIQARTRKEKVKKIDNPNFAEYIAYKVVSQQISAVALQEVTGEAGFEAVEKAFDKYGWKAHKGKVSQQNREYCVIAYDPYVLDEKANMDDGDDAFKKSPANLQDKIRTQTGAFNMVSLRVIDDNPKYFTFNFMCRRLPKDATKREQDLDVIQLVANSMRIGSAEPPFDKRGWEKKRKIDETKTVNGDLVVGGDLNNLPDRDPLKKFFTDGSWTSTNIGQTARSGQLDYFFWNATATEDHENLSEGAIPSGVINPDPDSNPMIYPDRTSTTPLADRAIDHKLIWADFYRVGHDTD